MLRDQRRPTFGRPPITNQGPGAGLANRGGAPGMGNIGQAQQAPAQQAPAQQAPAQQAQVQQAQRAIQVQPPPQTPATQAQPTGLLAAPPPPQMGGQAGPDMGDPRQQKEMQHQQIMSTFGPQIQEVQAIGDALFKQYGSDQTAAMADPRYNQLASMSQKLNAQIGAQMQQLNRRDAVDVRDPGTRAAPQNIQGATPVETMANYRAANQGETMGS